MMGAGTRNFFQGDRIESRRGATLIIRNPDKQKKKNTEEKPY